MLAAILWMVWGWAALSVWGAFLSSRFVRLLVWCVKNAHPSGDFPKREKWTLSKALVWYPAFAVLALWHWKARRAFFVWAGFEVLRQWHEEDEGRVGWCLGCAQGALNSWYEWVRESEV